MKERIKEIFMETNLERMFEGLMFRKSGLDPNLSKIQAIIGPRRVGKTSTMLLIIQQLLEQQVPRENILYFNFEDDRVSFRKEDLDLVLQAWRELFPHVNMSDIWFFFDEVQAAEGWEYFLNRINERISKHIFFTGSNSALLHTEIKSVMRGRSIAKELLPLSFLEYCTFENLKPQQYGIDKSKTIHAFEQYMEIGGYPEIVRLSSKTIQIDFLQAYYNTMLLRDIVEFNHLSNYSYLRSLFRHLSATIGKTISVRRLHNQLKSQGYTVGLNSIYEVLDMAENAYLFKRISKLDYSPLKSENSDKKVYWIDNGLLRAINAGASSNHGMLLENLVFWELYRRYGNIYSGGIYYYKDANSEVDFVVNISDEVQIPIQVCWDLSDFVTKKREIKGLVNAAKYCKTNRAWLLTHSEEDEIETEGIHIKVMPTWKWCILENHQTI